MVAVVLTLVIVGVTGLFYRWLPWADCPFDDDQEGCERSCRRRCREATSPADPAPNAGFTQRLSCQSGVSRAPRENLVTC